MQKVSFDSAVLNGDNLSDKLVQFVNARVLRGEKLVQDHVWVKNGKIIDPAPVFYGNRKTADIQVDCGQKILSPGFIDIQLNGGFGVDFSTIPSSDDQYLDGLRTVSRKLLAHGVTSYAPTLITSSTATYKRVLPLLKRRNGDANGAGILGAHLEGPFISPTKKGCHPGQYVTEFGTDPQAKLLDVYGSFDNIALVTLAPELKGSEIAIRDLVSNGVVVSLGHSTATLDDGERAIRAGASVITHLFNAMQSYHHRDPGLIGLLTSTAREDCQMNGFCDNKENAKKNGHVNHQQKENENHHRHQQHSVANSPPPIYYGIISDGIHTDDSALRIAHRTNPDGMILVTDAIAALGMEDGRHKLGAQTINVKGLCAILEGTDTTAGSVASMPLCVRHLVKAARCSLEEALVAATQRPASLMSLSSKGSLDVGKDADMVLISDSVDVLATFVDGHLVYNC